MRIAPATIHVSSLALALVCQCAQAAPPDRESPRAAPPAAAPVQSQPRLERVAPAPSRNDSRSDSRQFEPRQQDQRAVDSRQLEQRTLDSRQSESRVDDLRRQDPGMHKNEDAFRRNGRLTADERRDLRRQINEAGQDIYRNPPRR